MIRKLTIPTGNQTEFVDITSEVQAVVSQSGIEEGICHIFVPHTTAGITINEGADPSVKRDILSQLNKVIPFQDNYQHREGNSPAHIKASLIGSYQTVFIEEGRLVLGTWQSIYFCEFDGPRQRQIIVKIRE